MKRVPYSWISRISIMKIAILRETVRNERGMEEAERQLKHQHRVYCLGRSPVEGDPRRKLEPQPLQT
jgi:hypothetical protein